ncbi:replication protein RepA [Nocardia asteroides]|uniref:replication protein RepA n=1 Tax=Nocardia asteroides TaxID=1824 RepID=UPI0037CB00DD
MPPTLHDEEVGKKCAIRKLAAIGTRIAVAPYGMLTPMARPKKDNQELALFAAELNYERANGEQEIGYMGRLFTQFSLPYKDPGDAVVWGRQSGNVKITVQPGATIDNGVHRSYGYPFGGIPRLVLAHITTEVIRTSEERIDLGASQNAFMRTVGLGRATGGRTGNIARFQTQTERLLRANIVIDLKDPKQQARSSALKLSVASSWDLWWSDGLDSDARTPRGKNSSVTVSSEFYRQVMDHPVPVDMKVLNALQGSPMAMDIYIWLTYRMYALETPYMISWENLMLQFGSNLSDTKQGKHQFKNDFEKRLKSVVQYWEDLKVDVDRARGLMLYPSPTHVPKRAPRRAQIPSSASTLAALPPSA